VEAPTFSCLPCFSLEPAGHFHPVVRPHHRAYVAAEVTAMKLAIELMGGFLVVLAAYAMVAQQLAQMVTRFMFGG
jgi:hypothetical protein